MDSRFKEWVYIEGLMHGKSEIRSILLHGRSWQNMASTATARPPGR